MPHILSYNPDYPTFFFSLGDVGKGNRTSRLERGTFSEILLLETPAI